MKKFILKGLVFLAIFVLTDFFIGVLFTYLYNHANGGETGEEKYVYNELNSDVIFIGSSRCYRHYNPTIFEDELSLSAYNCGISGQGILMLYPRISMLCNHHKPKVIVYDVYSGFDLQDRMDRDKYMEKMKIYYKSNEKVMDVMDSIDKFEKYKILSNAYKYNSKLFIYLSDLFKKRDKSFNGFTPVKTRMKQANPIADVEIKYDSLKLYYIEELVKYCQEQDIQLFFALSPMYGAKDSHIYMPLFEIAEKYGVHVLDHYADSAFSGNSSYFSDRVHLCQDGADIYSSLIAKELKELETNKK